MLVKVLAAKAVCRLAGQFVGRVKEVFDRRELTIPEVDQVVQATLLDGTLPQWRTRVSSRRELADWITSKKNPFFARATVNRLWGHFFGVGIVDPIDDFTATNRPSVHSSASC